VVDPPAVDGSFIVPCVNSDKDNSSEDEMLHPEITSPKGRVEKTKNYASAKVQRTKGGAASEDTLAASQVAQT
jgi:hypothetical protein